MDVKSFLPPMVLEKDRDKPWMEWVPGTVLFADVSGFTPMSEALSVLGAEGAEILTDILNRYFKEMIGIIHAHGGQVMKFGGDAILCFFPENGDWHMRSEAEACLSPLSGGGKTGTGTCEAKRRRACPRFPGAGKRGAAGVQNRGQGTEDRGQMESEMRDAERGARNSENGAPALTQNPKLETAAQAEACGYISNECHPELDSGSSIISALHAAWLMQKSMARFQNIRTPVKKFALKMKIGIAHGECLLAGVGDPDVRCDYVFAGAPVDATSDAEHRASAGEIVFAGDEFKVQSSKFKVEAIEPGFWRIIGLQPSAFSLQPEPAPPSAFSLPPSSLRSYLIAEVHDLVAGGHAAQVGALLEIVPVFLKFTGFTYTREAFDLALFHAFFRTVMEITHQHGGRLNRISMGDKGSTALLLFGAPNPMEKKEQLAGQWALDLTAAVRARFPRLTVGIGLNSGRVFTGIVGGSDRWEYTVMGDAVNFAARLMQGAEAGQACVSESFAQRAREVYGFDDLGRRRFKGKAEPLAVFALKERRRSGWTAGAVEKSVGREKETEVLLKLLDAAHGGSPGMAVVEGEPGVGKSFLSSRILQEASRKGWKTVPSKGEITRRNHAYAPWKEVFSDLLFRNQEPTVEELARALDEEQKPLLAWFCEFLDLPVPEGTPRPAYDEETRKRLFQHHLSRLLLDRLGSRVSGLGLRENDVAAGFSLRPDEMGGPPERRTPYAVRGTPYVLFLDDLHWFDTLSLEFLAALLNHFKDQRLFILAATRPEWEKKDFENRATVTLLSLADLDRDGCRALAEGRLGGKVRDVLTDFLYERTGGNPFFTHQLLDYLLQEDLLETRLGEWLLKRGVEQKGAMTGTEVLLAQVNRLPASEQAHLKAAACMGPTFSFMVLKAVLGRAFRTKTMDALKASGYLFEQGGLRSDAGPSGDEKQRTLKGAAPFHSGGELETRDLRLETVSFPHALVQETIYQSLPQRVRKRLHRRIGLSMETLHAGNLEPLYPNLANHFHLAGHRAKAVDYCLLAGKRLTDQISYPEACNFYQLAYGYLKRSSDPRKWETGLALAEIQLRASKLKDGLLVAMRLTRQAQHQANRSLHVKASLLAFDARQLMGNYGYISVAQQLLRKYADMEDSSRFFLMFLLGNAYWRTGDYDHASACFNSLASNSRSPCGYCAEGHLPIGLYRAKPGES